MPAKQRLYLAGPDVFLSDAEQIGRAKVALCDSLGFEGLFPLDKTPLPPDLSAQDQAQHIYRANVALMRSADAVFANVTPFRGPSADVGTAFEMGFFAALGKPIFAYSAQTSGFAERTRDLLGLAPGAEADSDGHGIEPFGLPDNLMLPGAVTEQGVWIAVTGGEGSPLAAMAAFEQCLRAYAARKSSPSGEGGSAQR